MDAWVKETQVSTSQSSRQNSAMSLPLCSSWSGILEESVHKETKNRRFYFTSFRLLIIQCSELRSSQRGVYFSEFFFLSYASARHLGSKKVGITPPLRQKKKACIPLWPGFSEGEHRKSIKNKRLQMHNRGFRISSTHEKSIIPSVAILGKLIFMHCGILLV